MSDKSWEHRRVAVGKTVTLKCPIDATRDFIQFRWYKDDKELTLTDSYSSPYKLVGQNQRKLVIKDFGVSAVGKYTCKGVNGFGSASYHFMLSLNENKDVDGKNKLNWNFRI